MSEEQDVNRAHAAKRLMEDPLLIEAFDGIRQTILNMIESAPIRDRDGVHELKLMLKILKDVRAHLELAIADGKVAEFRIKERNTLLEFGKRMLHGNRNY